MNLTETLRLKTLALKDRFSLGPATDNRTHLDAAIAWLKHAQDVTGNGGVAQTYLVKYRKWAPALHHLRQQSKLGAGETA